MIASDPPKNLVQTNFPSLLRTIGKFERDYDTDSHELIIRNPPKERVSFPLGSDLDTKIAFAEEEFASNRERKLAGITNQEELSKFLAGLRMNNISSSAGERDLQEGQEYISAQELSNSAKKINKILGSEQLELYALESIVEGDFADAAEAVGQALRFLRFKFGEGRYSDDERALSLVFDDLLLDAERQAVDRGDYASAAAAIDKSFDIFTKFDVSHNPYQVRNDPSRVSAYMRQLDYSLRAEVVERCLKKSDWGEVYIAFPRFDHLRGFHLKRDTRSFPLGDGRYESREVLVKKNLRFSNLKYLRKEEIIASTQSALSYLVDENNIAEDDQRIVSCRNILDYFRDDNPSSVDPRSKQFFEYFGWEDERERRKKEGLVIEVESEEGLEESRIVGRFLKKIGNFYPANDHHLLTEKGLESYRRDLAAREARALRRSNVVSRKEEIEDLEDEVTVEDPSSLDSITERGFEEVENEVSVLGSREEYQIDFGSHPGEYAKGLLAAADLIYASEGPSYEEVLVNYQGEERNLGDLISVHHDKRRGRKNIRLNLDEDDPSAANVMKLTLPGDYKPAKRGDLKVTLHYFGRGIDVFSLQHDVFFREGDDPEGLEVSPCEIVGDYRDVSDARYRGEAMFSIRNGTDSASLLFTEGMLETLDEFPGSFPDMRTYLIRGES